MDEQAFNELFGTKGRLPAVCAVTGRPLQKSDSHRVRRRIAGTPFYVLHTLPLSDARLDELTALAKAGSSKAAKAPTKES